MTITPDKSALAQARERLEDECQRFKECYRFDPEHADVRLVLEARAEAFEEGVEALEELRWSSTSNDLVDGAKALRALAAKERAK